MLPFWHEQGRNWAANVIDGLNDAAAFNPDRAMAEWIDWHEGSNLDPIGGEEISQQSVGDSVFTLLRALLEFGKIRREFADGYRAFLAETRVDRKLAERRAADHAA